MRPGPGVIAGIPAALSAGAPAGVLAEAGGSRLGGGTDSDGEAPVFCTGSTALVSSGTCFVSPAGADEDGCAGCEDAELAGPAASGLVLVAAAAADGDACGAIAA